MPGPIATTVIAFTSFWIAAAIDGRHCDAAAFSFGQRLGHQFRSKCGDAGEHALRRCDRAESGSGAQSSHARHAQRLPTCPAIRQRSAHVRTCPCCCRQDDGASSAAKSRGVASSSASLLTMASGGDPMGAITMGPRVRSPKTCAGRGAVKVTIASAWAMCLSACG